MIVAFLSEESHKIQVHPQGDCGFLSRARDGNRGGDVTVDGDGIVNEQCPREACECGGGLS